MTFAVAANADSESLSGEGDGLSAHAQRERRLCWAMSMAKGVCRGGMGTAGDGRSCRIRATWE